MLNKISEPFMTESEKRNLSVTALANRPNEISGQYGRKGMTPEELKTALSALPVAIADKLNTLLSEINNIIGELNTEKEQTDQAIKQTVGRIESDPELSALCVYSAGGELMDEVDLPELLSAYWSQSVGEGGEAPPTADAAKSYGDQALLSAKEYTDELISNIKSEVIEKLIHSVSYDNTSGVLCFSDQGGTEVARVNLPVEQIIENVEYADGCLTLTFLGQDPVSIQLERLLLPEWITNLFAPSGSLSVPPTSGAVKNYVDTQRAEAVRENREYVTAAMAESVDGDNITAYISVDVNCCGIGAGGAARIENVALQFSSVAETKTFTIYGYMYGGDTGGGDAVITFTTSLSALANGEAINAHVVCRTTHYEGSGEHEGDFTLRNVTRSYFEGYNFDDPSGNEHIFTAYIPNVIFYDQLMLERAKAYTDNAIANAPTSGASLGYVNQTFANAIKGSVSGEGVAMKDDVSAFSHTATCNVESKNLISHPYVTSFPLERKGVGYTLNADNSITVNGTATADSAVFLHNNLTIPKGTYVLSGASYGEAVKIAVYKSDWSKTLAVVGSESSSSTPFTLAEDTEVLIYITVFNGETANNITVYPQIEKGTVATSYAPWVDIGAGEDGAINGTVTRYGKNLVDVLNRTAGTLSSGLNTTQRDFEFDKYYIGLSLNNYYNPNNVTAELNGDKWIITQEHGYGVAFPIKALPNTTYNMTLLGGNKSIGFYDKNGVFLGYDNDIYSDYFITPENCEIITVCLQPTTEGVSTEIYDVMLVLGSVDTTYAPYISPVEYAPNTDGEIVGGIPSLSPSMTLIPNLPGVIVNAAYNRDTNAVIADLEKKIAALETAVAT
ncbi:MAG: hypothetical protein IJY04_04885 [Clostridia bacterium]|nr:hypothetical protein [Clostridia bacterium]